jgi:hypothetical protein
LFHRTKIKTWTTSVLYTSGNPSSLLERGIHGDSSGSNHEQQGMNNNDDDPSALERPHIVIDRVAAAQLWHLNSTLEKKNEKDKEETHEEEDGVDQTSSANSSANSTTTTMMMDTSNSLFEQARSQLNNAACWQYRTLPPKDTTLTHMAFEVELKNEMKKKNLFIGSKLNLV